MTGEIHSTAIVDPSAKLGAGVKIGPYAIVEAGCEIGAGCEVRAHAVICTGTVMGPDNQIGYGAIIGAEPQDLGFKGTPSGVVIGTGNKIREYVTVHRAKTENGATRIGDHCFIMTGTHVGHDSVVGNHVIMANNTLLGGHVTVGDRVFFGGGTVVHQNVRIGTLAITQGNSGLSVDVPPYFMAVRINIASGLNRVGMKRAGLSPETRRAIHDAYLTIYRSGLNTTQALEKLAESAAAFPEVAHLVDFIAKSKRGICREAEIANHGVEE